MNDLKERLGTVRDVRKLQRFCDENGITYVWANKFLSGAIPNPGIMTLDALSIALDKWEGGCNDIS